MAEVYSFKSPRDELNEMLGGGIPQGSIVLIEGEYGAGKSAILQRFVMGFLENNYTVTLISTELTVKEFIEQMYSLDYRIATYLLNGNLLYIPVYPLIGEVKSREDFVGRLINAKTLFNSNIIVIDTLSSLLKHSLVAEQKVVELVSFFKKLSSLDKSVLLSAEKGELNENLLAPFKSVSHAYFTVEMKTVAGTTSHFIVVNRFSNTENPVEDTIGFRVEPKVGIIIEITTIG